MSTFEKARWLRGVFLLAIPLFFAAFLLVVLTQSEWALFLFVPAIGGPLLALFLSGRWPTCPACGEQVLEEEQGSGQGGGAYGGGFSIKLDPPKKECGYCGNDLTRKSLSE